MAQLINEIKRMQILAGIINESQLNEEDKVAEEEKVQDQVEKAINSSQAQATLQKMADQLSDEDKQHIMKFMSSVNESISEAGEPDLEDVTKKLMALAENSRPQEPQNRSNAKHLLGQVGLGAPVVAMGVGLIKGILVGGAAVGLAAAKPFFAAAAAGAVLIGLYKLIKYSSKKRSSKYTGGTNIIKNPILKKSMNESQNLEEENLEEGFKEWVLAGLITLGTIGGGIKVYQMDKEAEMDKKAQIEYYENVLGKSLDKMDDTQKSDLGYMINMKTKKLALSPYSKMSSKDYSEVLADYADNYIKNHPNEFSVDAQDSSLHWKFEKSASY